MTDEALGDSADGPSIPPASTRWAEDTVADDDVPSPPFVPGRKQPSAAQPTESAPESVPEAAPESVSEATPDPVAEAPAVEPDVEIPPESETEAPAPLEDEPFPFDIPVGEEPEVEEVEEVVEVEQLEVEEPGAEPTAESARETEPAEDPFPYERFNIEGRESEGAGEPEEPAEAAVGWTPADLGVEESDPAAPQAGPETSEWETTQEPAGEPVEESVQGPLEEWEEKAEPAGQTIAGAGAAPEAEAEVAALLDRLAGMLRSEGEAAVRREMESSDRLTALVAGLVAGYLSGRS